MIEPRVSIIIPVYNVELYLRRCIDSVINQTYTNIQVILVDDGSTDSSGNICDEYVEKTNDIIVIHKRNGGLSDARNQGLIKADGDYILFVDSDDYIAVNAVEELVMMQSNRECVDVVIGKYEKIVDRHDETSSFMADNNGLARDCSGCEYLKKSLSDNTFIVTAWSKMYRKDFIDRNELCFAKGLVHEDELFTMQCLLKADFVVESDIVFYRYMIREGSIMNGDKLLDNAISLNKITRILDAQYDCIGDKKLQKLLRDHSGTILYQGLSKIDVSIIKENNLVDCSFLKKCSISLKNRIRLIIVTIAPGLLKYTI